MKKLWRRLAPFSPDTSGVCSELYGLNGLVMIHDARGCKNTYIHNDEIRKMEFNNTFFSSETSECDLILGNEKGLIEKTINLAKSKEPNFIALVGSPISMLIGTDMEGIASELEEETGIPTLGINSTGHGYYSEGCSIVEKEICKKFVKKNKTLDKSLNILGANQMDFGNPKAIKDLKDLIKSLGWKVISSFGVDSKFEDILNAASAEVNFVVSNSGLAAAKFMLQRFDIPFIVGFPVGETGKENLIQKLEKKNKDEVIKYETVKPRILIIGEQVLSNGIRNCLRNEFNLKEIQVASFFGLDKEYCENIDRKLLYEDDVVELINNNDYDLIIGDPLISRFISDNSKTRLIELPHFPISSRIFVNEIPSLVSKLGSSWIRENLYTQEDYLGE